MRSFASDNNSGVHPLIMQALADANVGHCLGYGDDPWTEEATRVMKEQFSEDAMPLFVLNGTGSNVVAMQMLTHSFQNIYCARTGHIFVDECGAPAKAIGCGIVPIDTPDGKLTPLLVDKHISGVGEQHHSQPGSLYISQATELGTIYRQKELTELCDWAHRNGMLVHMDGARLHQAAAALGTTMKAISQDCGVDTLTVGGTKNGLMMGECVMIFNHDLQKNAIFYRKQATQTASKMRFITCQFTAMFKDELWRKNAEHANRMATRLHNELVSLPKVLFTQPTETNQLFLAVPHHLVKGLAEYYKFFVWDEHEDVIRFVTTWDTTDEDIDGLVAKFKEIL